MVDKKLKVYCETSFWFYLTGRQFAAASILDAHVDEVEYLAAALTKDHAVPVGEATDAAHIATAAVYGMDVLLTWNCRHMANPVTLPKTAAVIAKNGFDRPIIITPEEFLSRKEEFAL